MTRENWPFGSAAKFKCFLFSKEKIEHLFCVDEIWFAKFYLVLFTKEKLPCQK